MEPQKRNKLFIGLLIFILLPLSPVSSLDIQRGRVKLVLHETTGRFSVYLTEDVGEAVFQPLFVAEDPKTTKITVQVDERYIVLGDDQDFQFQIETTPTGGKITWNSNFIKIEENFDFVTSNQSSIVDGLQITFSITNLMTRSIRTGMRFLLDTNLGEKKDHFLQPSGDRINTEFKFDNSFPDFLVSPSSKDNSNFGLLLMLSGGATKPNSVHIANWKRLTDSSWDITYKQGRDFNLMPYSFNDSAIAMYYDKIIIEQAKKKDLVIIMGSRSAQTFSGSKIGTSNALSDMLDTTRKLSVKDQVEYIKKDRETVEDLISQINKRLNNLQTYSEEDFKILQAILAELEQRKKNYQE